MLSEFNSFKFYNQELFNFNQLFNTNQNANKNLKADVFDDLFNSQFSGVQFVFNSKNDNKNTFNTFDFNNNFTFNDNLNVFNFNDNNTSDNNFNKFSFNEDIIFNDNLDVFNFNDNNTSKNSFNLFNLDNCFQSNQNSSIINLGSINFASDSQAKSTDTTTNNQTSVVDSKVSNEPECTYDKDGNLVSKKTVSITESGNDKYKEETITTYDANGKIAKETFKSYENGVCYYVVECEYDEKGKKISASDKFIFDDGTCNITKFQYIYDDNGNQISEKQQEDHDGDGIVDRIVEYDCTCDKNGNVILKSGKEDEDADGVFESSGWNEEYTYDENGNQLTGIVTHVDSDGTVSIIHKYACTYDQDNRTTSVKSAIGIDATDYTDEMRFTYDENGNSLGQAYILTSKGYAIEEPANLSSVIRNEDGTIEITKMDGAVVKYDAYGKELAVA